MIDFGIAKTFGSQDTARSGGVTDLLIVQTDGISVLYAASGPGGGVEAMPLSADGTPLGGLFIRFAPGPAISHDTMLVPLGDGAQHFLAVAGRSGSGAMVVKLRADGTPERLQTLPLGGTAPPVLGTELGAGRAALLSSDGVLSVVGIEDGALSLVASRPLLADVPVEPWMDPGLALRFTALARLEVGSSEYLVGTVAGVDRVMSWRIGADGAIMPAGGIGVAEGFSMAGPAALATVGTPRGAFVITAAAEGSTLGVLRLGADGALSVTDTLADGRALRIGNAAAVDVVTHEGQTYVIAGGNEAGVSVLVLGPDGRLYHLGTTGADPGATIGTLADIEAVSVGGRIMIYLSGQGQPQPFALPVETDGFGGARMAQTGETLAGGARDDILIATFGARSLAGGAGSDLFVFGPGASDPGGYLGQVEDFEAGRDRLDLSGFSLLASAAQVRITPTATGAQLAFRDYRIDLYSADGKPLDPALFDDATLFDALHLPFVPATDAPVPDPLLPQGWLPTVPAPHISSPFERGFDLFQFRARHEGPENPLPSYNAWHGTTATIPDEAEAALALMLLSDLF
jgi:hypothetical protein